MKLYHVSRNLNFQSYFYPRIPNVLAEGENDIMPRICFAKTIEDALTAMPDSIANPDNEECFTPFFRVYEYEVDDLDEIYDWEYLYKNNLVMDAFITEEVWVKKEIYFKPENSYLIGVYDFQSDMKDVIPAYFYYEAMKKDGDYLGLYIEKVGTRVPFIYTLENVDYIKINEDLSDLDKVNNEYFRFNQDILDKSIDADFFSEYFIKKDANGNLDNSICFEEAI